MTANLLETIRRIVRQELAQVRTAELGVVESALPHAGSSDHDNYACDVRLRNSGLLLKAVPVLTQRIGAVAIPSPGELVIVQFLDGDINAPVISGRAYTDQKRPPVNDVDQAILHLPLDAADSDAVHLELSSGDARLLSIRLGDGVTLTLQDDDPVLKIAVDGQEDVLKLDRDGALTVKTSGAVNLKGEDVTVEASGTLTLKGSTVNIN